MMIGCVRGSLEMDVYLSQGLNQDHPLPVDVVAVCDPKMLDELLRLNAHQWFGAKFWFQRRFREGRDFQVWSWEWVPGQDFGLVQRRINCRTLAILVFAGYRGEGTYRAYIRDLHRFRLELHDTDFGVFPIEVGSVRNP